MSTRKARVISSAADAKRLAEHLLNAGRDRLAIVVTRDHGGQMLLDLDRLERELDASIELHAIESTKSSWAFKDAMPEGTDVFGGAGRVYPTGDEWQRSGHLAPLFIVGPGAGPTRTQEILDVASSLTRGPLAPAEGLLTTQSQVIALASYLLDPARDKVVVVVTCPRGSQDPYISVAQVKEDVGHLAAVYVLPPARCHELGNRLPDGTQVFGGAARVYPRGLEWTRSSGEAPLHLCFDPKQGTTVARQLVIDALTAANRAGTWLIDRSRLETVEAEVKGIRAGKAILASERQSFMGLLTRVEFPALDDEQLVWAGMTIRGKYCSERKGIYPDFPTSSYLLGTLQQYDVVAAEVASVQRDALDVRVHPSVMTRIRSKDVIENSVDLRTMYSAGDVVPVLVKHYDKRRGLTLAMLDVDDQLPAKGLSLLPGGPEWISYAPASHEQEQEDPVQERVALTHDPDPAPELALPAIAPEVESARSRHPSSAPGVTPASLGPRPSSYANDRHAALEQNQYRDEIARLRQALERSDTELVAMRKRLRKAVKQVGDLRSEAKALEHGRDLFADPERQLRHEVLVHWARRHRGPEQEETPLREFEIGPEFIASVNALQGIDRTKIIKVIVEIATGHVHSSNGRDTHVLRRGSAGNAPVRTRMLDGKRWTCYRTALEQGTASARRLHFWMSDDKTRIELANVGVHDSFAA